MTTLTTTGFWSWPARAEAWLDDRVGRGERDPCGGVRLPAVSGFSRTPGFRPGLHRARAPGLSVHVASCRALESG